MIQALAKGVALVGTAVTSVAAISDFVNLKLSLGTQDFANRPIRDVAVLVIGQQEVLTA